MLWLFLLLPACVALADESSPAPSPDSSEPAFCSDPVAAICEQTQKVLPDYAETRKQLDDLIALRPNRVAFKARLSKFQEMEKQSFIPLLDEARIRLIDGIETVEGLEGKSRSVLKETLSKV